MKYIYLIVIAVILFIGFDKFFTERYLFTEQLIFEHFSLQLNEDQINDYINFHHRYSILGYFLIILIYLSKVFLVSICIYLVFIILNYNKLNFRAILYPVIVADLIFLLPKIIKLMWFTLNTNYTLVDLQYFMPGSLLNFINHTDIELWLVYPFQSLNIWELGFIVVLAYQLKEFFQNDFALSLQNVLLSYGTVFLLWIVFVVFITLNLS